MLRHATVAALSVSLLLSPCPLPAAPERPLAVPTQDELTGAAARPLAAPAPVAADPDALSARVAELAERCKPVDYDPDLRARELGDGVESALAFVRDRIRFEAYPGAFRGAAGAYRARAANAADRSLLLADMLAQKRVQTRFARGRLARADAERLLSRVFDPPPQSPAGTAQAPAEAAPAPGAARNPGDFAGRVRARALRDFAAVTGALGAGDGGEAGPTTEQLIDEVTPHVWVQAKVGQQWIDLDASFPDAAPGKAYCPVEGTSAALPADGHQRVTVRVVAERLAGGAVKAQTALEVTRPVADLVDRHVFLLHAPAAPAGGAARALGGAGDERWVPVLWIDGETTQGKPVNYGAAAGGGEGKKPGGVIDLFGGLPGGDAPAPADAAPDQFVREVLEFELLFPGGRREVTRRVLCDRGGEAWRRALPPDPATLKALPHNARGPLAPQAIHSLWFSGGRHDLAALADALTVFARPPAAEREQPGGGEPAQPAGPPAAQAPDPQTALAHRLWPMSLQHLSIAFWGDHVFVPSLNTDPAARFYLDAPRILLLSAAPAVGEAFVLSIDLRRDRVRGVARDASTAAAVRRGKIWYGLLGGALEHELAARQAAAAGADAAAVGSTSGSLGDGRLKVLRAGQVAAEAWETLAARREVAARAAAALSNGETLVVPAHVAEVGAGAGAGEPAWWAVSAFGDTRAVWGPDLHASNWRLPSGNRLPPGSRGMQSGGWRGRSWAVDEDQVRRGSRGRPGHGPRSPRAGRASQEYVTLLEYVSTPISELTGHSVGYVAFVATTIATEVLLSMVLYEIASSDL